MSGYTADTIAAIATSPGGGIGIVRVSGPRVTEIARNLLGSLPEPRHATLQVFRGDDGTAIDTGLALYFPAPFSFTGEPVLELHGHGGSVVMQLLLSRVLSLGARQARPGEFSERAFLNDKIDLAQAEAIADLIESSTSRAARAAIRSLEGEFSGEVHAITEDLVQLRVYVEAAIDFPDEEIDFLSEGGLQERLQRLNEQLSVLLQRAHQGRLLRDGLTLVIAGRPNAGKSSLLNALSGRDSAIVTAIPGTTRDVLREQIQLDGMPLHVLDTAGLHSSDDLVEQAGMARARGAMQTADHVLLVVDDTEGWSAADAEILCAVPPLVKCTLVYNKIDLSGRPPGFSRETDLRSVSLSTLTGAGLPELRSYLKSCSGYDVNDSAEGAFSARQRHIDALLCARAAVDTGITRLQQRAGELLAEDLRYAQLALGEITGEVSNEDLLDRIFSSFCIGK